MMKLHEMKRRNCNNQLEQSTFFCAFFNYCLPVLDFLHCTVVFSLLVICVGLSRHLSLLASVGATLHHVLVCKSIAISSGKFVIFILSPFFFSFSSISLSLFPLSPHRFIFSRKSNKKNMDNQILEKPRYSASYNSAPCISARKKKHGRPKPLSEIEMMGYDRIDLNTIAFDSTPDGYLSDKSRRR